MKCPLEWEFEVYRLRKIELRSGAEVADRLGCSPWQVAVICRKVAAWKMYEIGQEAPAASSVARLEKNVEELDGLFLSAWRAFQESNEGQEFQVSETIHADGRRVITTKVTRRSDDAVRCLDLAVSIAEGRCRVAELLANARHRARNR